MPSLFSKVKSGSFVESTVLDAKYVNDPFEKKVYLLKGGKCNYSNDSVSYLRLPTCNIRCDKMCNLHFFLNELLSYTLSIVIVFAFTNLKLAIKLI